MQAASTRISGIVGFRRPCGDPSPTTSRTRAMLQAGRPLCVCVSRSLWIRFLQAHKLKLSRGRALMSSFKFKVNRRSETTSILQRTARARKLALARVFKASVRLELQQTLSHCDCQCDTSSSAGARRPARSVRGARAAPARHRQRPTAPGWHESHLGDPFASRRGRRGRRPVPLNSHHTYHWSGPRHDSVNSGHDLQMILASLGSHSSWSKKGGLEGQG